MTDPRSNIVLDVDAFKKVVGMFAKEAPELLTSHPKTAHLGLELERLKLQEALDHQFTVAIVGRMKSGKSTLLNVLLGTNALPMGISETTATVNWLWHGTGDRRRNFRVHWRDGTTKLIPLEEVGAWIGKSKSLNISNTKYLEFFVDSPFLKVANFVDTPGTETTDTDHEKVTRDFITAKLEEETLKHGGFASAILYVLGSVPTKPNVELIELCGINTRLPGSSPTNSIAVVQKWDQIAKAGEDPLVIVAEHCERWKQQLQGQVSEVLTTCPPLEIATEHANDLDIWNELAKRGAGAKSEKMGYLLEPDCFGSVRERMRESISKVFPVFPYWPVIRFSVQVAHTRQIDDGEALRKFVKDASGIDKLKRILKTQFLDRSYLLHASAILAKVAAPCDDAEKILLGLIHNRPENLQNAMNVLKEAPYDGYTGLDPIRDLLREEIAAIEKETHHAVDLRARLSGIQEHAKISQGDLDADICCLDTLAEPDISALLNEDDIAFLQRLFGTDGMSVKERLGLSSECELSLDQVNELYDEWFDRGERAEDLGHDTLAEICGHAAKRLHDIATYIEGIHTFETSKRKQQYG
jgi:hypothetical protein